MSTSQQRYHGNNDGLSCTSYYRHHSYRQQSEQQQERDHQQGAEIILQQQPIPGEVVLSGGGGGGIYPSMQQPMISYSEAPYCSDYQSLQLNRQGGFVQQQENNDRLEASSSSYPMVPQPSDIFAAPCIPGDPRYNQSNSKRSEMVSFSSVNDSNLYQHHQPYNSIPPNNYSPMEMNLSPFSSGCSSNNNDNNDLPVPYMMSKKPLHSYCGQPPPPSSQLLSRPSANYFENKQRFLWHSPMLTPPEHMQHLCPSSLSNSNGREARNRAEKNRRDKLNNSIQELSGMVPHVAESPRRVDKTAVLRYSAHGLRFNYVFGKSVASNEIQLRTKSETTDTILNILNGFMLTVTCRGQIVLVTNNVEQYLGHCQTDLYGQNIINITHPDDHSFLKQKLIPTDLESLFDLHPLENGEPRPRSREEEEMIDSKLSGDRRDFTIRMARAGPRSEPTVYEIVRIDGSFRRADLAPRGTKSSAFPVGLPMIRRARTRDESFFPPHAMSGNDIVLVGRAQIIKPPQICDRLIEACKTEYKTRHLIDGRIVQCDQRISIVAGYLTEEVAGLSPFSFMHKDDVRWVMVALRQMYDYNQPYGESCYRLIARNGQFIYLKTRGYLEIDKDTNKVHSFCCVNTMVTEDEGKRMVNEMKRKFSIIIKGDQIPVSDSEEQSVENPHQIERAIMNLITNLSSANNSGSDFGLGERSGHRMIESPVSTYDDGMHHDTRSSFDSSVASPRSSLLGDKWSQDHRKSSSPPLAIIAPKPSTIKSSVTKSVQVIVQATGAINKGGHLHAHSTSSMQPDKAVAPKAKMFSSITTTTTTTYNENLVNNFKSSPIDSCSSSTSTTQQMQEGDESSLRPSVLQRNTSIRTISSNKANVLPVIKSETTETVIIPDRSSGSDYGDSSQLLKIKQEIQSDPINSPASSTVSSLSYDNQIGSNASSSSHCYNSSLSTPDLCEAIQQGDHPNSDEVCNESRGSTLVLKRTQDEDNEMYLVKRRRNEQSSQFLQDDEDQRDVTSSSNGQYGLSSPLSEDLTSNSDLLRVLPSSFDAIDRSLLHIETATESLRGQCLLIDNANSSQNGGEVVAGSSEQLAEILEEHQEQREILNSIKEEFEKELGFPGFESDLSVPLNSETMGDGDAVDLLLSDDDSILYGTTFDTDDFKPD